MHKFFSIQSLRKQALFIGLVAVFSLPQLAHASLIGQTVTATYMDNTPFSSSDTLTVGAGAEILGSDNTKNLSIDGILFSADYIDFGAGNIVISLSGGGSTMTGGYSNAGFDIFGGARFEFTGFNFAPDILSGVSVGLTNATGISNADISYTSNSVTLNNLGNLGILGSTIHDHGQIILTFNTSQAPQPPTPSVPEPGTLALLGLGLAGLGLRRSKHFNRSNC